MAEIYGCGDLFAQIVLPLSKAILAVLTLYYAVGHWNGYFNAFIYLTKHSWMNRWLLRRPGWRICCSIR